MNKKITILLAIVVLALFYLLLRMYVPCELQFGVTCFDDYCISNKILCYEKRASEGDYQACLHTTNPDECLLSLTISKKELFCDKVSDKKVRDGCIKLLFDYYRPVREISKYVGIERIRREEEFILKEGEKFPYTENVEVRNGKLQQPGYVCGPSPKGCFINRWEDFDCAEEDGDYKIVNGRGAHHKLGEAFIFIESCDYTTEGVVVNFIHFQ